MGKFFVFCRIKLQFCSWLYKKRWKKFQLEIRSNKKVITKKPLTNLYEVNSTLSPQWYRCIVFSFTVSYKILIGVTFIFSFKDSIYIYLYVCLSCCLFRLILTCVCRASKQIEPQGHMVLPVYRVDPYTSGENRTRQHIGYHTVLVRVTGENL